MIFKPGVFGLLLLQASAGGCYLMTFVYRFTRVNRTFYRLHGVIFLVFSGLAFFFQGPSTYTELEGLGFGTAGQISMSFLGLGILGLMIYNYLVFFGPWEKQNKRSRSVLLGTSTLHLFSLGSALLALSPDWRLTFSNGLAMTALLSASFLLGAVVLAMNLGHFYLTNPTLPIEPLLYLTRILTGVMILVAALSIPETIYMLHTSPEFGKALRLESFQGLYVWGRLLLGIVGGLVITLMALKTVRMHSTQAATGLLYIELIFVLFGQAFANFLFLRLGVLP
ncbi:MAG: hypothetical protein ACYDAM_04070 [Leptospirales bacterium]